MSSRWTAAYVVVVGVSDHANNRFTEVKHQLAKYSDGIRPWPHCFEAGRRDF